MSATRPRLRTLLCVILYGLCTAPAGGVTTADGTSPPQRVVSIGGSITEIIYLLDLADRLVAVDSTSRYPSVAAAKPDVGYMRALGTEPILALTPDLVLAMVDAGPPSVFEQLAEAGTPVVRIPDEPTLQGVLSKVDTVAEALGEPARGAALRARLESEFRALGELPRTATPPRVLFLLSVGTGTPLAGGIGTSAAGIIDLAGGINAVTSFAGYKPLSPEAAITAAPDVILITDRTLRMLGGADAVLAQPWVAATPAGRSRRVVAMDGLLLLGFGPRTAMAVSQLARELRGTAETLPTN